MKGKPSHLASEKVCQTENKLLSSLHDQSTKKYYIVPYANVHFHLILIPTL